MARVAQSRAELERHLAEQVGFLRASCDRYDEGHEAEHRRIATSIRILCHERRQSRALLAQLGYLSTWRFLDTAGALPPASPNAFVSPPLARFRQKLDDAGEVVMGWAPSLRSDGARIVFFRWWKKPVLNARTDSFSRRDLIMSVADTDGGAHVDPGLNPLYHALSRTNSVGTQTGTRLGDSYIPKGPMESPVPACVRQIAFEVLATCDSALPLHR
jgi:hypothetical protein